MKLPRIARYIVYYTLFPFVYIWLFFCWCIMKVGRGIYWTGNMLYYEGDFVFEDEAHEYIDWLNEHHFDYRGLIEKGLAIEAPEGMYNVNEK